MGKLSAVEAMKAESHGLRGTIGEELASDAPEVSEATYQLLKFHGTYEQYDRDTATPRKQQGLPKEYGFMLRVRMPGGRLDAGQWLALDRLANDAANGTLRITTRQGIQFHGVLKGELKPAIAAVNAAMLTTICACGDVVRNITASPTPVRDAAHARIEADARRLSEHMKPKSRAYYEIFLDEEPGSRGEEEEETLYGPTYLPRKFKIGITTEDDNSIDVLTNDLGIVAHFDGDTLLGYTLALGGGLGMTHNRPSTYPRLATPTAFVGPDELIAGVEAVIRLQRDHGDRGDRRRARLKYVMDDRGLPWIRATLAEYFGRPMAEPRPLRLRVPELLGWHAQGDGRWWLGVPVMSGRVADAGEARLRSALREVAERFAPGFTLTPQQDVLLTDVAEGDRAAIDAVLREHGVVPAEALSPMARFAMACPALPTCGLALTEAERVQPDFLARLDALLARHGVAERRLSFRVTGCPNGCARTYAGDLGLVGRMPGFYAVYAGGDFEGTRLSFKLLERAPEKRVIEMLEPLIAGWAESGTPGFGDWLHGLGEERARGMVDVAPLAAE